MGRATGARAPGVGGRRGMTAAAAAASVALAVVGCGEDDVTGVAAPTVSTTAASATVSHVHGLGVNPADDALIIATHHGLLRAAAGEKQARPVGDRRQDTMGFTVIGPDRFLGSGHPDPRDKLPPLLGLIDSQDAGRSWKPISLLGEADFHVLRASGRTVYGVNASDGALMVSGDAGRRWQQRTPPGSLLDLAIDPTNSQHVVASGSEGTAVSTDGGKGWRPQDARMVGLLAWTEEALVLVRGGGDVHSSTDGGRSWKEVGNTGGRPVAFGSHGTELLAALGDNTVRSSVDGGQTWKLRART